MMKRTPLAGSGQLDVSTRAPVLFLSIAMPALPHPLANACAYRGTGGANRELNPKIVHPMTKIVNPQARLRRL
ncbi:hypothetical protein I0D68_03240 [Pseudomonas lalucatii]|nr:hypothetical protein [Pseudomonas lalucatii]QVM89000.1 hypothetical protein I0D68_03240 [Pseudomonas lalucatii]